MDDGHFFIMYTRMLKGGFIMKYFISGFLATFCMLIISDKMLTKKDSNK